MTDSAAGESPLRRLARHHHIDTSYVDASGEEREVSDDTLVAVLRALGVPLATATEAESVIDGEANLAPRGDIRLPPVVVAWDGRLPLIEVGPAAAAGSVTVELALEDGADAGDLVRLESRGQATVLVGRGPLPFGLHEIAVELPVARHGGGSAEPEEIVVISAPSRSRPVGPYCWGVFAPVYALSDPTGNRADLTCLARLGRLVAPAGCRYLATLPILADFSRLEEPDGETKPYSPISRMWWNEGVIDPRSVPELARLGLSSPDVVTADPTGRRCVDIGRRAAALRPALAAAAHHLAEEGGARREQFEAFVAARPDVVHYAQFRAACEARGTDPSRWPSSWRRGLIDEASLDEDAVVAHTFAQFVADEQIASVAGELSKSGVGILLDLPVGCRADGFDPWAYPESFVEGATIGAPPDLFFRSGQDWGFRPLHPEEERRSGYEVTRGALSHLLRHAGALRLDHAMSLARLWWIPEGLPATDGAYVRYHTEEMLALCCLEAWRSGAALVGEDLGTVEASLTDALADHGIAGMHVAVFDLEGDDAHPMEPLSPRSGSAALVDTHDTATFPAWFSGSDITLRRSLGLLEEDATEEEAKKRARAVLTLVDRLVTSGLLEESDSGEVAAVHEALVAELARSAAGLVIINPEDCWGELDPQNVPGTTEEHANFCRPFAKDLSQMEGDTRLLSTFARAEEGRNIARLLAEGAMPPSEVG